MMNPQVRSGEDAMSRITYCMMNEETGLKELQNTIIEGLNTIARHAAHKAGHKPEEISEMTLVGNTAMHHILLGINPEFMGSPRLRPRFTGRWISDRTFRNRDFLRAISVSCRSGPDSQVRTTSGALSQTSRTRKKR